MLEATKRINIGIELIDDPSWMGGMLYLRNLALGLSRLPEAERPNVHLLGPGDVVERFLAECGNRSAFAAERSGLLTKIGRRLGMSLQQPTPMDAVYPGFGQEIPGAATIRWIPDFQHRYLPHLFSAEEIAARDASIGAIAAQSGVVVFSSEVAAADFRAFYPQHLATPKVWHFCSLVETLTAPAGSILARLGLPQKFLYLPNQFWAHKNHITVLKALTRLKREHDLVIPLVCTGAQSDRRNEGHFDTLMAFIGEEGLSDQVHLLGLIDRNDQVEIFRHAAAVVQPSLFEGWSTVVEDVRAVGRPIFLSDLPVHREQAPDRCWYFDAATEEDLARLLAAEWDALRAGPDTAAESAARDAMRALWLNSAREFCAIVHTAMQRSSPR